MKRFVAAVIGVAAVQLVFAQGGFGGPGRYQITNLKSGRLLAVDRNDQTTVVQLGPRNDESVDWIVEPGPNGAIFLRSALNGGALQITSNARSSPVVCGRFDGGSGQQWRLEPGKDGNPLIVSSTGRVLDIPDGSNREGLRIQIYDKDGDSNQRFVFRRLDEQRDRERERRERWQRWERERH